MATCSAALPTGDIDQHLFSESTVGSADFKEIGVAFLREHFLRAVRYADGKGDGGRTLARYEVEVEVLDTLSKETPLRGEPSRAPVLLRHDRAVVRALQRWAKVGPRWLVCTADGWLRALLNDLEIVALDSVGLGDLLELVKPADAARALLAPRVARTARARRLDRRAGTWVRCFGLGRNRRARRSCVA